MSPQKILSQTSKIERATHLSTRAIANKVDRLQSCIRVCRHKKSLAKHQKSSERRTCQLVRSQIKSIAYNQTNPLEPEIRRTVKC
ncbi:hypothetical protein [Microcoleus sp. PH2017_08_TRC_O_A]|uniref:hypothetical protein n=1 Tax=Microcoleus sp. PH2017_08_TRC_O_A TaxID=2798819 RepID=UPI001D2870DE|nr:hypothetical protein [Microcoleus sp. PH2017_08_TRC_O_A]MCC3453060.1 hypothetical protein [Microcoleus sp. PH2017_08_TRC_O_A]